MAKLLRCGDLVKGCPFEARGSEDEILKQAGAHAVEAHKLEVTPELVAAVKGVLKEEPARV